MYIIRDTGILDVMLRQVITLALVFSTVMITGCASEREIKVNDIPVRIEEPDKDQIQADLIGSHFSWNDEQVWFFAALSEFDNVSVNNKIKKGNVIEYDVTFLLREFALEKHYIMDVFLVYRNNNNKWQLTSYLITDFREMELQTHLE
jgi:hypothetical protein